MASGRKYPPNAHIHLTPESMGTTLEDIYSAALLSLETVGVSKRTVPTGTIVLLSALITEDDCIGIHGNLTCSIYQIAYDREQKAPSSLHSI